MDMPSECSLPIYFWICCIHFVLGADYVVSKGYAAFYNSLFLGSTVIEWSHFF